MTDKETKQAILSDVVTTFVTQKASLPRRLLLVKFRNEEPEGALSDLVNGNLFRRQNAGNNEAYLPTAAAFQFSGDNLLIEEAKSAVSIVLHALQNMSIGEPNEKGYTLDDLKRHVSELYHHRDFDDETLKLGLYLAQDFGVLAGVRLNSPADTEIVWFQTGERAITLQNIESQWDKVTASYMASRLHLARQDHRRN